MRELVTIQVGGVLQTLSVLIFGISRKTMSIIEILASLLKDELLGLVEGPSADPVFRNQHINMDVLYRTGETPQVINDKPCTSDSLHEVELLLLLMKDVSIEGSLGSMTSLGTLYNESPFAPSDVIIWSGKVSTHASEPPKKNLFLQRLCEEEQGNSILMNDVKGPEEN